MRGAFQFDATDCNIVEMLRQDGQATNQEIAKALGLTAATVSTRIKRMEDANQLRVVAVSDFAAHGYTVLIRAMVEVDRRAAVEVAGELAALPEVFAVHIVTGRYEIDMLVALHSFEEFSDLVLSKFSQVKGIHSIATSVVVDIVKYNFDIAPIEI